MSDDPPENLNTASRCDARMLMDDGCTVVDCDSDYHLQSRSHSGLYFLDLGLNRRRRVSWSEADRRNFRGDHIPCEIDGCKLPDNHRSRHKFKENE